MAWEHDDYHGQENQKAELSTSVERKASILDESGNFL